MHVIGDLAVDQINELVAFGQVVDHQNVGDTASVKTLHQITSDKSGSAGHYHHVSSPAVTTDVPNLPTTTPPARFAHAIDSPQDKPAARVTAKAANTVSPAPDTSNTSCA